MDQPIAWKPIPGYEGWYEVSSDGQVRSVERAVHDTNKGTPRTRRMPSRVRTLHDDGHGYWQLALSRSGEHRVFKVHRLVCLAFHGLPEDPGLEVCHVNGSRKDNRASNLRWGTRSDNMQDAVRHGTHHNLSRTHCRRGHEFTVENTYVGKAGRRQCRPCSRMQHNARNAKLREARRQAATLPTEDK